MRAQFDKYEPNKCKITLCNIQKIPDTDAHGITSFLQIKDEAEEMR